MNYRNDRLISRRRTGAAMIVCLVLLALLATFSGIVLKTVLEDRSVTRKEFVRNQIKLLLQDGRERAELQRQAEPEFTGDTQEIKSENPGLPGTFRLTSTYNEENKNFDINVVFQDKQGKTVIAQSF